MEMPNIDAPFADKHLMSLNYVDIEKANEYQGVGTKNKENQGSNKENDDNESETDDGTTDKQSENQ